MHAHAMMASGMACRMTPLIACFSCAARRSLIKGGDGDARCWWLTEPEPGPLLFSSAQLSSLSLPNKTKRRYVHSPAA